MAIAVLALNSIPLKNENILCSYFPIQNKKAQLRVKLSPSRGMVEANREYSHVPFNREISLSSCEFDNLQFALFGKRRSYGNADHTETLSRRDCIEVNNTHRRFLLC